MKKLRKPLALILALALCIPSALAAPPATEGSAGDNVTWSVNFSANPNTITFSGTGPMADYTYGSSNDWNRYFQSPIIIQRGITYVGKCAFYNGNCASAVLYDSVTSIGSGAFQNCKQLTSVTILNGDVEIAENAFKDSNAITSFLVGDKNYGTPAAYFAEKGGSSGGGTVTPPVEAPLVNYVAPAGTTTIDTAAFIGNTTLETVVLPEGVTSIGNLAFASCPKLRSVTLPSTLTTIGDRAFQNCSSLETVVLPEGFAAVGESAFQNCAKLRSVTFPSTLTTLSKRAFKDCPALAAATLPDGLAALGEEAFWGCTGLKSLKLPAALTAVAGYSFQDLTALETVTLPEGLTAIGDSAFAYCVNLKDVALPSTLTEIGGSAFQGCTALTSIQLPEGLETLADLAFWRSGLTAVTVPQSVTAWGGSVFADCPALAQVTLTPGLETIGAAAFAYCPKLTEITLPEGLIYIGGSAFRDTGLTQVTIPASVTEVGAYAFGVREVDSGEWENVPDFKIIAPGGSAAEDYAKEWKLTFENSTPSVSRPSVPRHTHSWDEGVIVREPTERASGLRKYTCASCGAVKTESISAGWSAPVRGETVTILVHDPDDSVAVPGAPGGKVTIDNPNAQAGDTVTITLTPKNGYAVDTVAVLDSEGSPLPLTKLDDTHYTFTMPEGKVTVETAFRQVISFIDVPEGAFYADAVNWAVARGITTGTSATTFSPDMACTRAQIVTFLWRAAGSPKATAASPFTDVPAGSYYAAAVQWAVEQGITAGTGATTFSPDMTCTRAQAVTFLYRYEKSPVVGSGNTFADVVAGSYYAKAVQWAVDRKVTSGTGANTFSPNAICTRSQIVTFLYRDMA